MQKRSWLAFAVILAAVVAGIKLYPQNRSAGPANLFAFTYGSGVWKVTLPGTGSPCTYSVSPSQLNVPAAGGAVPVNVSTGPGCAWIALPSGVNFSSFVTPQDPAQGVGPGTAYLAVQTNSGTATRSETLYVQGQLITVNQAAATLKGGNDEISTAINIASLPYIDLDDNTNATSNPNDPNHSCTGSQDALTVWWKVTAPSSGAMRVDLTGERFDIFGDSGVVVTVYPLNGGAAGAELACATVARGKGSWDPATIFFPATSGTVYLIEAAAPAAADPGELVLVVQMATPPSVTVTPASQNVNAGQTQQFTANVTGGGNTAVRWVISPAFGTISPSGVYTAPQVVSTATNVTVTATVLSNPAVTATATITVNPPGISFSALSIANVWNSARVGGVSPGEVVVIYGNNMGPANLVSASLTADGSRFQTNAGGTQVIFDATPAAMIFSSATAIALVVPYEVAGEDSTLVQIKYNGQSSDVITVPVVPSAPGVLTLSGVVGTGQATVFNQDGSFNSANNAAAANSLIGFYITGEGLTTPATDGLINTSSFPSVNAPIAVTIGGVNAPVTVQEEAPYIISGVAFLQVRVPNIPASAAAPLVVTVGEAKSQAGVTVAVK